MIIDSLACYSESLDRPGGHKGAHQSVRWVQASYATHHQPVWGTRVARIGPPCRLLPNGLGHFRGEGAHLGAGPDFQLFGLGLSFLLLKHLHNSCPRLVQFHAQTF